MTKVFYSDRNTTTQYNMLDKVEHVLTKMGLSKEIKKNEKVMIKTHMGLWGNTNHIRPAYVRNIVRYVKKNGGKPFVADTCSLGYGTNRPYGGRTTAADYYERAAMNGFTQATVGAPIIIADGYWGADFQEYPIEGDYINSVPVPAALFDADKIVVLSHSKFHHIGLASTLKNMGVGLVAKKGKTAVHSKKGLEIDPDECKGEECSMCVSVCPTRCITVSNSVKVDMSRCIQCGHCSSVCGWKAKAKALKLSWSGQNTAEVIVENTAGVLKAIGAEKFYFVNLAIDISDMCDCVCYGAPLLMHDLGVFGSRDPLALDVATAKSMGTAELNSAAEASSKVEELLQKSDTFFEHGVKMKIGSLEYELVNLSKE
jgi:uncharacterized Fe-S center protein